MTTRGRVRNEKENETDDEDSSEDEQEKEENIKKSFVLNLNPDQIKEEKDNLQIPVQEFIPGVNPEISLFSTWSVYGKRKTGKSVFVKWNIPAYKHEIP